MIFHLLAPSTENLKCIKNDEDEDLLSDVEDLKQRCGHPFCKEILYTYTPYICNIWKRKLKCI